MTMVGAKVRHANTRQAREHGVSLLGPTDGLLMLNTGRSKRQCNLYSSVTFDHSMFLKEASNNLME